MSKSFKKYTSLDALSSDFKKFNVRLKTSNDFHPFHKPVPLRNVIASNSLVSHSSSTQDSQPDGSPSDLTFKRYQRLSKSGAGTIFFEPIAINRSSRLTEQQLYLHSQNVNKFKTLVSSTKKAVLKETSIAPICILQLTHHYTSQDLPQPSSAFVMQHDPYLHRDHFTSLTLPPVTDKTLEDLEEDYVQAAILSKKAGFDGIDINGCMDYLSSELLCAYRRGGKYGGKFNNRTRFLRNIISKIRAAVGHDFIIGCHLNIYNALPYPNGFGVDKKDCYTYDLSEPIRLIGILRALGLDLLNATMSSHTSDHPLQSLDRLAQGCSVIQHIFPDLPIISCGYDFLGEFAPLVASTSLQANSTKLVAFNEQTLSSPQFIKNMLLSTSQNTIASSH